jgi:predicted RNA-binding protein with PIN domain
MSLLIDGYNLLHATAIFGAGGNASFRASREALLDFLAAAIDATERTRTTIVFDAAEAPPGLPLQHTVEDITVYYARDYESADDLLEELIAAHHAPRQLVVVSSDHRVQRAAKKRRATAIDSHVWYGEIVARLSSRRKGKRRSEVTDVKPDVPLSPGEVAAWVRMFGPIDASVPEVRSPPPPKARPKKKTPPAAAQRASPPPPRAKRARPATPHSSPPVRSPKNPRKPPHLGFGNLENPFPPGYGEDLLE